MQDFNPDCTINLSIQAQGKPGKFVWACSLVTRDSVRLVLARKFLGIVNRDEAEWSAALFGLSQAQRLMQEKVQLCSDFGLNLDGTSKHRDPKIQLIKARAEKVWSSFRLRKLGRVEAGEERILREEALSAFSRKSRER